MDTAIQSLTLQWETQPDGPQPASAVSQTPVGYVLLRRDSRYSTRERSQKVSALRMAVRMAVRMTVRFTVRFTGQFTVRFAGRFTVRFAGRFTVRCTLLLRSPRNSCYLCFCCGVRADRCSDRIQAWSLASLHCVMSLPLTVHSE